MEYYENLNKVIDEIENNLTEKIDYKNLAKIVGTSSYTLQRIFVFLTGITLTEYIKKRRLSKAAEEIISTDIKIIDVALKYQYDSPISFSNSFKKMHGISPQNLRKNNLPLATIHDENGEHTIINRCPHMKCSLIYNQFENVWECPCHASKFDIDGNCLKGPSKKNISYKE